METLLVGTAQIDITPPVGTPLAGGIYPRTSVGVHDPLYVKVVVLESKGKRLAYGVLDLCVLRREVMDEGVRLASEYTGIPEDHIFWATSHTHSGPYTMPLFGYTDDCVNKEWLKNLPGRFAECVAKADEAKRPARMSHLRAYNYALPLNRRLRFKDGREINNFLLERGEEKLQCIGTAGPIDPEIGILAFDDEEGNLLAVLYNFALHLTTHFGDAFSADYPFVVERRVKEAFGEGVAVLFMPGAMGDINTFRSMEETGNMLADSIIPKLLQRKPQEEAPLLAGAKCEVTVPYRDLFLDYEQRIRDSQWPEDVQEVFRQELEIMRKQGITEERTLISAWRIGEVGFAGLPGELFVQWGLKIKEESPFPWTYPVELCGDYLGYLVTESAWRAGGYESLVARTAKPSPEGVGVMVSKALDLLRRLYYQRD